MKRSSSHMLGRLDYLRRHLYTFLPHLTVRKISNLFVNSLEMYRRVAAPRSLPPYMKVEPTPLCQLRCASCLQRDMNFKKSLLKLNNGKMYLSLDDLKTIVEPIKDTLIGVSLSHYGETMLNPNLSSLIEYLHRNNIAVSFPTNLSINFNDGQLERFVNSGLDCLEVALDGTTEETYSKYRIGGDFHLVLKNVRLIADRKKALGIRRPRIVWKFVEFEHNRHETELIGPLHRGLGFDGYEIHFDNMSKSSREVKRQTLRDLTDAKKACFWPWNTTIIRWDGSVKPCCTIDEGIDLGNAIQNDIRDIWRSENYRSLREGFARENYGQRMAVVCKTCLGLD